jgi:TonB family protein
MKTKIFFLIFLFIISFGCKDEKNEIEIIPASEMIYSMKDLDSPPKLKSKDLEKTFKEMMELNVEINKFYTSLDSVKQSDFYLSYNFTYNVEGQLYKVQVIKSDYPELDKKITEAQKKWDYEPSLIDDKPVNFFMPWTYNPKNFSNKITPEMIEHIHSDSTYFVAVENMPEPIGGLYAIQSKIKYPEEAKRNGIEGKVFVLAFIDEKGNVANAKVIKGAGYGMDEAALDAVKQTKFTPGKQRGKPVKVQVTIPIVFKLK